MSARFTFVPPPEAPIFRPSDEEFKDPLAYLMKIRNIGMKTGICKIIPPKSWNPPFAVNMKEFTFTPRIQRLYELEGGDKIRVPSIGGRFLDLHALHKAVHDAGGYERICSDHNWASIAEKLGYAGRVASSIKNNYEKLLLAFDRIVTSKDDSQLQAKRTCMERIPNKRLRNTSSPVSTPCYLQLVLQEPDNLDLSINKELRNLRFFGAGPKAAVPLTGLSKGNFVSCLSSHSSVRKNDTTYPDVDTYTCRACNRGDDESNLLVCDTESCQACYHLYCLSPPLRAIPNYHWKCPECVRSLCVQPPDPYGFPQSSKTYSLHEFGVMADEFKSNYFGRPCCVSLPCLTSVLYHIHDVPCSVVEQEFWRILQEYNDDIVVEYGADIHSSTQGSGFPTVDRLKNLVGTAQQLEDAKMYAVDPWNLNILPLLDRSILRFIKGNIDGMKIPWCYVGMVFSSFCWHIEDHWTHLILDVLSWITQNYMRFRVFRSYPRGEPKTWYGVSRLHAEDFERAMRKHAPDLFEQAPDLLHHITTNMNPNILQAEGVPVYRTDQYCGEFVVTFPRAYHAGFNQGFNFAEAVNICLPDWLPIGRACVDHYAVMKRHCVFSNEELLCTLAEVAVGRCRPEDILLTTNSYHPNESSAKKCATQPRLPPGCSTAGLDISAIATVHQEFTLLLNKERRLRQIALNVGVVRMEKVRFDELWDDVRVCDACSTTLFLSGISCPCASSVASPKTSPPGDQPSGTMGRKRRASDGPVEQEQTEEHDASSEEKQRTRRFMVCLQHFDELCPNCEPSACILKYHYTIEELEDLESALARCSNAFYDWRRPLLQVLTNSNWNSSSFQTDKQEPPTDLMGPKPDSSPSISQDAPPDRCIMTLEELQKHLNVGRTAGYHVDEVFTQAQALYERANKLLSICASVKSTLTSLRDSELNGENKREADTHRTDSPSTLGFLLRLSTVSSLPSTTESSKQHNPSVSLHHEIDLNNIRELDLVRLMEACKQQYPINLMTEPDVWFLQDVLNFLNVWRQSAREAIGAVCRLTLPTATRSLTTHCPSNITSPLLVDVSAIASLASGNTHTSPNDEAAFLLLSDVVRSLSDKYPQLADRLPDWNSLNLLHDAFKWMCVFQRQTDEQRQSLWTYPRLRQHLHQGENLLLQLNSLSSAPNTKSPGKTTPTLSARSSLNSSSSSPSLSIDLLSASVPRILRARMRTSVAQLSQSAMQVESLVGALTELLGLPGSFSCPEVLIVLGQIQTLRVSHLTQWDSPVPDKSSNCTAEPSLQPTQESKTVRLDKELVQHYLPETAEKVSSLMSPLCSLLSGRIRSLLSSVATSAVASRPQLVEAEVLLAIGLLLDTLPVDMPTSDSPDTESPDGLSADMKQLNSLISATRTASSRLWEAFLAARSNDQSDNAPLVRHLLPKFPLDTDNDTCFYEFMDAYAKSPPDAVDVYTTQTQKSRNYLTDLLETFANDRRSCSSCSERLALRTTQVDVWTISHKIQAHLCDVDSVPGNILRTSEGNVDIPFQNPESLEFLEHHNAHSPVARLNYLTNAHTATFWVSSLTGDAADPTGKCLFCPLFPDQSNCASQDWLTQLNSLWGLTSTDGSKTKPLCTPQAVAYHAFTEQLDAWLAELSELLRAHAVTLGGAWVKLNVTKPVNLPAPVQSAVDTMTSLQHVTDGSNVDCEIPVSQQLRTLLLLGCTFPVELDTLLSFLQQLAGAL
ncbi:PHD-finger [Opisthorchis viverrini]|uniref:[histone H3]-trimethyl-L-lysine(4) demethylase n=1 Tax=Opisthorchis viverrini TaxID=6198 RepID=A0A1S8WJA3_OPIVI|nr:PHD-finger [Opisthorchis viverrini]